MSFFENTRRPDGFGGRVMVAMMNLCHKPLSDWGLRFVDIADGAAVLDCGCGGGANMARLLKRYPGSVVKGIDYSPVSVEKAQKVNRQAIREGRCTVVRGSVADMLFAADWFDVITAFETVYFWPDLAQSFREVRRVLKPGGVFCICSECADPVKDSRWPEIIDGMTVYTGEQLRGALEQAGFHDIQAHRNKMGWLCVTARK